MTVFGKSGKDHGTFALRRHQRYGAAMLTIRVNPYEDHHGASRRVAGAGPARGPARGGNTGRNGRGRLAALPGSPQEDGASAFGLSELRRQRAHGRVPRCTVELDQARGLPRARRVMAFDTNLLVTPARPATSRVRRAGQPPRACRGNRCCRTRRRGRRTRSADQPAPSGLTVVSLTLVPPGCLPGGAVSR